jgi:2-dehydro-3-deoxyphosphogluconate aldolase/(4S)-4-hydroxy-2-oxoglutarate aldolase
MRDRIRTVQTILDTRVIAIIRTGQEAPLAEIIEALVQGGVRAIEVTATTPGALEALAEARREVPQEVAIGCGTVLDSATAAAAARVGLDFIVSPSLDSAVVETAHRHGCTCIPGCLTPTEIVAAMNLGVDLIKVFPAGALGPSYIKSILAPLPEARLVPVGGVEADTVADYLASGAVAVGVGGSICSDWILREEGAEGVCARAAALMERIVSLPKGARHAV